MKKALMLTLIGGVLMATELEQPFAKGEINPYSEFFTGKTYLHRLISQDDVFDASSANVTFEPSARTNWHTHDGGQILLVTAGEGRYQEEGKPKRILKKGDVVMIPPFVKHWHGAAPKEWFAHISLQTHAKTNKNTWLEKVSDEVYLKDEK